MHKIFKLSYFFNVRNVVIMSRSNYNDVMHFYTYEIFTPDHCYEKITISEINRFENGRLQKDMLFPDHIMNYFGCSLTVSAHIVEPLISFDGDIKNPKHLMEMQRLGGIEGEILNLLSKVLNFKFKLRFPSGRSELRYYGNSTGIFGDVSISIFVISNIYDTRV